jgi:iron complex outermembrane recepter protein
MLGSRFAIAAALVAGAPPAIAQRAGENDVTAAEDAFGTNLARGLMGLCRGGSSANAAGRARIDALFFDPV